jgi:hypothetical protein
MTDHGAKFGRKKEDAILALLTHQNLEQAARSINIAPRTLMRWMKVPEFQAAYRPAARRMPRRSPVSSRAPRPRRPPCSGSCSTKARRPRSASAECVLNHSWKAIEIEDFEARVAELERAAQLSDQD